MVKSTIRVAAAGIAGVDATDAGAASGLVNTAHQLGSALGLGLLVAVSTDAGAGAPTPAAVLAAHVGAALTGSAALLALALGVVVILIVPSGAHRRARRRVTACAGSPVARSTRSTAGAPALATPTARSHRVSAGG